MFVRIKALAYLSLAALISLSSIESTLAQNGRSAALRQAQQRGQQRMAQHNVVNQRSSRYGQRVAGRVTQGSGSRIPSASPIINNQSGGAPVATAPTTVGAPVVGGPNAGVTSGYTPQHLRSVVNDPVGSGTIVDDGSPIIADSYFEAGIVDNGGCCGGPGCGIGCNGDFCANRNGGCGPACWDNCWIHCLGGIFSNSEIVGGAHGFRSANFTAGGQNVDDSSFGFYGGINMGLSLCKLTCGLFSGQVGIRSSVSEFEGDFFSTDNRDQLFVTAGVFRRVDYGIQAGIVFDYLHEEWFAETDLAQVRGDIAWVYPGGTALGFRFSVGTEDDLTSGIINGVPFDNLFAQVNDNYRFYYRMSSNNTGHVDFFAGWSDFDDAVLGVDVDTPVCGCLGLQAGFTYFLPEDSNPTFPTSTQDAWNVYVGFALRPQGPLWYGNYDRPLFNVADNGTFVFRRN